MVDKELFAAIGERFIERFGGNPLDAAKFLKGDSDTIRGGGDSPFYTKIGPGSFIIARRGDSESDLLAKLYNLMSKEKDRLKKKEKLELRYQKQIVKIKDKRLSEILKVLGVEKEGAGVTKKKSKLGLIGLGVAGLLFSPDVMAMVGGISDTFDELLKNLDGLGKDLKIDAMPTITGIGPLEPTPYDELFQKIGKEVDIDPALLKSVAKVETGGTFKPNLTSPKGAKGLMQLMPDTAARYGAQGKEFEPESNVRAGAKYLKYLIKLFNGNVTLAVAAYNAGEGNVQKYGNQIPPFKETKEYVGKVMGAYQPSTQDNQVSGSGGKLIVSKSVSKEELDGIDPRLMDMIRTAAQRQGYNVLVTSGKEGRTSGTVQHPEGKAVDIQLVNPENNQVIENLGPKNFRVYEQFAQQVKTVQTQKYPDINLRWGGYFSNRGGKNVPMDLMHFDIMPNAMGGGSWETGLTPEMRKTYSQAESQGMTIPARTVSQTTQTQSPVVVNNNVYQIDDSIVTQFTADLETANAMLESMR